MTCKIDDVIKFEPRAGRYVRSSPFLVSGLQGLSDSVI